MSVVRLARPEIRSLEPYSAAIQVDDAVRLNANEAPWNSSGDRFRRPLNRYPEIRPARLQRELSERFGCDAEQLLVTRGSSEAIDLLIRAFCRAGIDNIVTTSPSFSMYPHYAAIQGAEVRAVGLQREKDFALDIDELLDTCDDETKLIFICTPNNPTGSVVPQDDIIKLLERRAGGSVVVVDEAYVEFADAASSTGLLDRYENLVVLRTLSKALAFAGARCGAAIGQENVVRMLDAIQAPYALATPVVECVENALQAEQLREAERGVTLITSERERIMDASDGFSFVVRTWPSQANFFLMQVVDAEALTKACRERNILLRFFGGALADCVRVSVGAPHENDCLLRAFAEFEGS